MAQDRILGTCPNSVFEFPRVAVNLILPLHDTNC
jgi:hypothetical protein